MKTYEVTVILHINAPDKKTAQQRAHDAVYGAQHIAIEKIEVHGTLK